MIPRFPLAIHRVTIATLLLLALLAGCGGGSSSPLDSDGDGVEDSLDAFPNDPAETTDTDSDGVGDNADNCVSVANSDQVDSDKNGEGDACDTIATTYSFPSTFDGGDSVSYTGQTARHLLMLGLVRASQELVERPGDQSTVESELRFYITGEGANEVPHGFMVSGGEPVIPGPNYGDVSSNKNLSGKIAGGDGQGGGETEKLINGEFFGGKQGILQDALPIDLVYYWIRRLAEEATDGNTPTISTATDPVVGIGTVRVDAAGRDYRQLLQKFLSGAVSLSQGTNDYFQTDWANALAQEGDKNFTEGEHNFDEAFGYYGAARDQNEYTDDEAAAKGGREDWSGGYHDTNEDGNIDIRSEFVLGHAQNCAKRDRGSSGVTDFSKEAMDAFLLGRQIVSNASIAGSFTDEEIAELERQAGIAALVWEKCIAATVIHYINDVTSDMGNFIVPNFADLGNFLDLAKHWSEMKGFALALQFSPYSPFRDGSVANIDLNDLREILSLMGDAPMLADGSQNGESANVRPEDAVSAYIADLRKARDILEQAYEFDPQVVDNW